MTYIYNALRENPLGLWSLDSSPFTDSSGYGNDASSTGTPSTTLPIVAGGISAQLLETGDSITYPIENFMAAGKESRAFTLEAWVKVQSGTSKIIGRDNSGLFIDGLKVRFSVDMDTLVSASFENLNAGDIYHIVGIYDTTSIYLIINGVSVASAEITAEDISAGFVDTTAFLESESTNMVIDSVAVYNYPLPTEGFTSHYNFGIDYPEVKTLSAINGGRYYSFSDEDADVHTKLTIDTDDEWRIGLFDTTIASVDNELVNLYNDTDLEFKAGYWTFEVAFQPEVLVLNGSRINWTAVGSIVVEKSTDAVTWTPLTNGGKIFDTQDLTDGFALTIRITFPDSVNQVQVSNLIMAFYNSKDSAGSDEDLPAVVLNPTNVFIGEKRYEAASFNDNAGILLPSNITGVEVAADPEFGGYFAAEMTVKFDSNPINRTILYVETASAQPSITTNASGEWVGSNLTALYIDGVAITVPTVIQPDKWHHVLAVFAESQFPVHVGNDITEAVGFPMRLDHLALYSDDITAPMADAIYKTWIGAPAIQIDEVNSGDISEASPPFRFYSFDWSINPVG